MAPKRPSPLDEPPTASSSDSEEDHEPELSSEDEQTSSQQKQQQQQDDEEEDDEEEEASSEEQEEDDDVEPSSPLPPPASKKPPPPPINSHPQTQPSSSESESDSDSDSDPDPPTAAANPKVKPLASKPMEHTPKPRAQPSAAHARSSSKRPSENNGHVTDPKRAKKKGTDAASDDDEVPATEEDGKKSGDDSKKLFQRIWSEEDEIAILKGMVEFSSKTGGDPLKDAIAFYDFMKKSLHADATTTQFKQKIRRLKKKFEIYSEKGKNGEGPSFAKPHDQKAFELSKKVWANGVVVEKAKSNGKARKIQKEEVSRNVASPKLKDELPTLDSKESDKMEMDEKPNATLHLSEMIRFDKGLGLSGLNEDVVKRGVELIGASKRAELEGRWKKLQVAELELYVKRAELIEDQARLILEAYKSSNP